MHRETPRTLIVGAGISGLLAARELARAGRRVLLLDKGRSPGGRLATRRGALEGLRFDHGAQYLTAREAEFRALVDNWVAGGWAREWSRGFALEGARKPASFEARFVGCKGMNSLARELAAGLDLRLECEVRSVRSEVGRWRLESAAGECFEAEELVLSAPVPQSLALLAAGGVSLPLAQRTQLEALEYAPCLALLVALDGPSAVPPPGGLWPEHGPLSWIADNQQKGISAHPSVTLHANESFSRAHFAPEYEAAAVEAMLAAARPWLRSRVENVQLHRWRYSLPLRVHPERCLRIDVPVPLVFAGDAFGGPRVEGAALSGLAAARTLLALDEAPRA